MPTLTKIAKPAPKVKGKRGRPKGSTNKELIHRFTAEDGCTAESGIKTARFTCKHGYDMSYRSSTEK